MRYRRALDYASVFALNELNSVSCVRVRAGLAPGLITVIRLPGLKG